MNLTHPQLINPFPARKTLPHEPPHWVRDGSVFFLSVNCQERGKNHLCLPEIADILIESVRYRQKRGDWFTHLFLLMPDHLHTLTSFPGEQSMKKVVTDWKRMTATKAGIEWQRDFFDHRIRDDESLVGKGIYIRDNPVRAKLVKDRADWPFVWEASGDGLLVRPGSNNRS